MQLLSLLLLLFILITACSTTPRTVIEQNASPAHPQQNLNVMSVQNGDNLTNDFDSTNATESSASPAVGDLYDKQLTFSAEESCLFRTAPPSQIVELDKVAKKVYNIIVSDFLYILGNTISIYDKNYFQKLHDVTISSGLLLNEHVIRVARTNKQSAPKLSCYQIPSGKCRWQLEFEDSNFLYLYYHSNLYILYPNDSTMGISQSPSTTPSVKLCKHSLDGTPLWNVELESIQAHQPHSRIRLYAAFENKLIFTDDETFLAAYDEGDGHELWHQTLYGSWWNTGGRIPDDAIPFRDEGGIDIKNRVITNELYLFDIDTGELILRTKHPWLKTFPCLDINAISDGIMFTTSHCDGPYIVAYDNQTGEQLWSAGANDGSEFDVNLFVARDLLISAIDGKPEVTARNKYTGEIVWQFNYRDGGELHNGSIFCQDDMLFIVDTDKIYIYGYGEHQDESSVQLP